MLEVLANANLKQFQVRA